MRLDTIFRPTCSRLSAGHLSLHRCNPSEHGVERETDGGVARLVRDPASHDLGAFPVCLEDVGLRVGRPRHHAEVLLSQELMGRLNMFIDEGHEELYVSRLEAGDGVESRRNGDKTIQASTSSLQRVPWEN